MLMIQVVQHWVVSIEHRHKGYAFGSAFAFACLLTVAFLLGAAWHIVPWAKASNTPELGGHVKHVPE